MFADIVKFGVDVTDIAILPVLRDIRDRHIDPALPPASTAVQVAALIRPGYLIEIDFAGGHQDASGDRPAEAN
jgi:enamine deaminase RidA (YjgF/YER057c/UK114 family)